MESIPVFLSHAVVPLFVMILSDSNATACTFSGIAIA
jgi:hypothetical protein